MERFELANGVRAVVLQVPDAPRQTLLTLLPGDLTTDPEGRAFWSRLVEQSLVRSTNPDGDEEDGISIKSETGPRSTYLETVGRGAALPRMAKKHAAWLATQNVDEETLGLAKRRLMELQADATILGATTNLVVAGWNQAIRHNRDEVRVSGDPRNATSEELSTYLRQIVPVGREVLVATVGPLPVEVVRRTLEETIGSVPARESAPQSAPTFRPTKPNEEVRVKWDLPTRHLVLWWPLSEAQMADRANLESAIAVMKSAIIISQPVRGGGRPVPVVEGPLAPAIAGSAGTLLVDIPYGIGTAEPADMRTETEAALRLVIDPQFTSTPWRPRLILPLLGMSPPPYTQQQRAGIKEMGNLLERQWMLNTMQAEYEWNNEREELARLIDLTTIESVQALIRPLLDSPPHLLVLEQLDVRPGPAPADGAGAGPEADSK